MQCATFSKSLNPRNIDKSVSDIRIRFPFESSLWISLSCCKLTILPDIQLANRIVIISDIWSSVLNDRWPESHFQTRTPLMFQNFWIPDRIPVRQIFKFENPTPIYTPATIIDLTLIYPCFYSINDHRDSCCCRNWKVTRIRVRFFPNFWLRVRIRKKNAEPCPGRLRPSGSGRTSQTWADIDFLTPDPHPIIFLISISNPYPKISEIWYPMSIHIRMQHWLDTKQTGSGYRFTSGPSFLRTYSCITCNITLIHDKCAVGW